MKSPERIDPGNVFFPLGRFWVRAIDGDHLPAWGEKQEEPGGTYFVDMNGNRGSYFTGIIAKLSWNKSLVARVSEACLDSGIHMWQMEIVPEVADQRIDDGRILKEVLSLVNSKKDGTLVCGEIAEFCKGLDVNDSSAEAIGLCVYLKMSNWNRI